MGCEAGEARPLQSSTDSRSRPPYAAACHNTTSKRGSYMVLASVLIWVPVRLRLF